MSNKVKLLLPTYTDDFGNVYKDFPFSIDQQDNVDLVGNGIFGIEERPANLRRNPCSIRKYFSMRKIIAIFTNATSIEIPVPSLTAIPSVIAGLRQYIDGEGARTVACMKLKGEEWKVIPPALLGGNYASVGSPGAVKPPTAKYKYRYFLDGTNNSIIKSVSVQTLPDIFLSSQTACLDTDNIVDSLNCVLSGGIKPRHFIGQRANTDTGGVMKREIVVSSNKEDEIVACGGLVMVNYNCLGYKGTTIENVDDFYADSASPATP